MPNVFEKLVERYPRLPALIANTSASKLIQLIKDKAIDPIFDDGRTIRKIYSWPQPAKGVAEWVMYILSGAFRTMPQPGHPVAIAFQEALAESLTQVGIKINEISTADRTEIIDATMPAIRAKLISAVGEDHQLKVRLNTILGGTIDWVEIIQGGNEVLFGIHEKTQAHREARRARGWRRFLW
ncbi:MAG: hypothetical protein Q8P69_01185 [bacterium]|nr:hypothetical protein [bacterium]